MSLLLKENSPVSGRYKARDLERENFCRQIQRQIDGGQCAFINLLEGRDVKKLPKSKFPRLFHTGPDGGLWTGNYVGQFEFQDRDGKTEQIAISGRDPNGENRDGSFFLQSMLSACWDIPMYVLESANAQRPARFFSELMLARLAAQLDRAWKKGQLRLYRTFHFRDSRVRGRVDLPRQIRESMGFSDGQMAYQLREFSEDNAYNCLFYLAYLEAERRSPGLMRNLQKRYPGLRTALRDLARRSVSWGRMDAGAILERTNKKISNPVYRDYETLRIIARAVLRQAGGFQSGGADSGVPFVTGIFLDVSQLWEDYLLKKVFRALPKPDYQPENLSILGGRLTVRPDFLWQNSGVILDAKYRFPTWGETLRYKGVWPNRADSRFLQEQVRDDVYQVLAYMLALNCRRGGVIFPVSQKSPIPQRPKDLMLPAENGSTDWEFWRLPFAVPDEPGNYEAFRSGMDREAARLSRLLGETVFRNGVQL